MKHGFIKYNRSESAKNLEPRPNENHLLNVIASRVSRNGNPVKGVQKGEALIGDYGKIGLKRQPYRTAIANLRKWGYITIRVTTLGTYASLSSTDVYDCNVNGANQPTNQQPTNQLTNNQPTNQPTANHYQEVKKERSKEERSKEEDIGTLPFLNEVTEILKFFISETGKSLKLTKIGRSDKYKVIMPKLKGGSTVDECKAVISLKSKQWKNDKQMSKHLCIPTLFRASNFEKYIDELGSSNPTVKKFPYPLPDFIDAEDRQSFFYVRFDAYKPHLDIQKVNTIYKKRALYEKDAEGLCFELELKIPKLAEMQIQYNRLT